jgi:hypothetical protein
MPNYGRVGCFKGFDPVSFAFNTKADPQLFKQQFKLMRRLVETGFDIYGYVTLTTPIEADIGPKMSEFVDRLQEQVHPIFPLRTVPLRIKVFTPTEGRVGPDQLNALQFQDTAEAAWNNQLRRRFTSAQIAKNITDHSLDTK